MTSSDILEEVYEPILRMKETKRRAMEDAARGNARASHGPREQIWLGAVYDGTDTCAIGVTDCSEGEVGPSNINREVGIHRYPGVTVLTCIPQP